jgi:hypothetical protein
MEDQNILEVFAQIHPFVRTQYPQRKADERPHMHNGIIAAVMLTELVNLGMAIMAAGDTVIRAGRLYLFVLQPAELQPLFFLAGLEKATAAAATIIVGPVGHHIHKVFFADDRFDHVSQIFGNGIAKGLAHDLTGVLDGKFNFEVLVPVGIDLEPSFPDPLGIVLIDVLDDKVMLNVEFFQSCQD